jgi:polar amino acid transport system substrate-binding protein
MGGGFTKWMLAWAVVALALGACGGAPEARSAPPPGSRVSGVAAPSPSPSPVAATCGNATSSLRPDGSPPPAPGAFPPGTFMRTIQDRGKLVIGASQDTMLFGYLNPFSNQLEGFDIDVLKEVGRAIFGDYNHLDYHVLTPAQRIPALQGGTVDIVGRTFTITCARWQQIDFSTVYYDSGQRILVPATSAIRGLQDLNGKRVCAPAGTTSIDNLRHAGSHPIAVSVPDQTDCLVRLQSNQVDAISIDESVLLGLAAQDPTVKLVGPRFTDEPYGLGISQAHPEFVRFVNGLLDRMRADGTWTAIYTRWLSRYGPAPVPPAATYRD